MSVTFTIRRAERLDASSLYALERACFSDPYPNHLIDDLMETERDRFFVAVSSGDIVGYAVVTINGQVGHVVSIAVHPQYRRQRIGTGLLSAALKEVDPRRIQHMYLEVRRGNADAISFYNRVGFKETSRLKRYYPDGEDALVMTKSNANT